MTMADSDAAAALKLHTRMDVILWNLGKGSGCNVDSNDRTKTIEKVAQHILDSHNYSHPYVMTCDAQSVDHPKIAGELGNGPLIQNTSEGACLTRVERNSMEPEDGAEFIDDNTMKALLGSLYDGNANATKGSKRRVHAAVVNENRVLVVSRWTPSKSKNKKEQFDETIEGLEKLRTDKKLDGALSLDGGRFQHDAI